MVLADGGGGRGLQVYMGPRVRTPISHEASERPQRRFGAMTTAQQGLQGEGPASNYVHRFQLQMPGAPRDRRRCTAPPRT